MAQEPKWRRRKEDRPNEIIAAALEIFAQRGFSAARLEDVAARAGVSKGTLYLYFPSKEELFKAVIRQTILANVETAEREVAASEAPTRQLLTMLLGGMMGALAQTRAGVIPRLIIGEAHNFPDLVRFYSDEVIARGLSLMTRVIERGVRRGEVRNVDAFMSAHTVIGPLLLLAIWKTVFEPYTDRTLDADQYLKTYTDLILNGLLSPAAQGD